MIANQVFLAIFALTLLVSITLYVISIKCGLKWAGIAEISFAKATGLFLAITAVGLITAVLAGVAVAVAKTELSLYASCAIGTLFQCIAACLVIAAFYKARLCRAAKAAIPYSVVLISLLLLAVFAIRPYAYEAFIAPTNSMAPTLLGPHWEAPCPRCGQPAYATPLDVLHPQRFGFQMPFPPEGVQMVCSKERRSVYVKVEPKVRGGSDRFLVCKCFKPRRWDIIVFRYPQDPSVKYAKRVVGLPGEKLEIHDGAIWINGERQEPPATIRGIRYSPTIDQRGQQFSGPGSVPVTLKPDEYFVIGDFVDQSSDSRIWKKGAPGHLPYAVPTSYIDGVVINIYWPPNRWTAFR